mmetsp:Transcript_9128/g.23170  ORF Transcript_9128/g.23170 Transcript_9128/m.23170 type:complete len:232 (+) Transcript_9128:511-1206(+)
MEQGHAKLLRLHRDPDGRSREAQRWLQYLPHGRLRGQPAQRQGALRRPRLRQARREDGADCTVLRCRNRRCGLAPLLRVERDQQLLLRVRRGERGKRARAWVRYLPQRRVSDLVRGDQALDEAGHAPLRLARLGAPRHRVCRRAPAAAHRPVGLPRDAIARSRGECACPTRMAREAGARARKWEGAVGRAGHALGPAGGAYHSGRSQVTRDVTFGKHDRRYIFMIGIKAGI